jgi:hypothetical protein
VLEKVISLEPFGIVGGFRSTTETNVGDRGVIGTLGVEGPPERASRNHSKSIREGRDVLALVARANKIVGCEWAIRIKSVATKRYLSTVHILFMNATGIIWKVESTGL